MFGTAAGSHVAAGAGAIALSGGEPARITFDAKGDKVYAAHISEVAKSASPLTGTFDVEIALDEPDSTLLSGLLDDAIKRAGEIRFVPILLTTLTATGGLIPLILERSPLYSPLAPVFLGGLLSSTVLTRVVTPVLYKLLAPTISDEESVHLGPETSE